jgi:hypothetical protein
MMKVVVNVIRLEAMTCANNILAEKLERRHHLGDLNVDGRIILKYIFNKNNVRTGFGKLTIHASEVDV